MTDLNNEVCIMCMQGFISNDQCNTCGICYIDASEVAKINAIIENSQPDLGSPRGLCCGNIYPDDDKSKGVN